MRNEYHVRRSHGTVTVKWDEIPDNVKEDAIQKVCDDVIGDCAAGTKKALGDPFYVEGSGAVDDKELSKTQIKTVGEKATELMQARIDAWLNGDWGQKKASSFYLTTDEIALIAWHQNVAKGKAIGKVKEAVKSIEDTVKLDKLLDRAKAFKADLEAMADDVDDIDIEA